MPKEHVALPLLLLVLILAFLALWVSTDSSHSLLIERSGANATQALLQLGISASLAPVSDESPSAAPAAASATPASSQSTLVITEQEEVEVASALPRALPHFGPANTPYLPGDSQQQAVDSAVVDAMRRYARDGTTLPGTTSKNVTVLPPMRGKATVVSGGPFAAAGHAVVLIAFLPMECIPPVNGTWLGRTRIRQWALSHVGPLSLKALITARDVTLRGVPAVFHESVCGYSLLVRLPHRGPATLSVALMYRLWEGLNQNDLNQIIIKRPVVRAELPRLDPSYQSTGTQPDCNHLQRYATAGQWVARKVQWARPPVPYQPWKFAASQWLPDSGCAAPPLSLKPKTAQRRCFGKRFVFLGDSQIRTLFWAFNSVLNEKPVNHEGGSDILRYRTGGGGSAVFEWDAFLVHSTNATSSVPMRVLQTIKQKVHGRGIADPSKAKPYLASHDVLVLGAGVWLCYFEGVGFAEIARLFDRVAALLEELQALNPRLKIVWTGAPAWPRIRRKTKKGRVNNERIGVFNSIAAEKLRRLPRVARVNFFAPTFGLEHHARGDEMHHDGGAQLYAVTDMIMDHAC